MAAIINRLIRKFPHSEFIEVSDRFVEVRVGPGTYVIYSNGNVVDVERSESSRAAWLQSVLEGKVRDNTGKIVGSA